MTMNLRPTIKIELKKARRHSVKKWAKHALDLWVVRCGF